MPTKFDFDVAFQGKILQVLYQEPAFLEQVAAYLKADLWDRPSHRWLVDKILEGYRKYGFGTKDYPIIALQEAKRQSTVQGRTGDWGDHDNVAATLSAPVPDRQVVKDKVGAFIRTQNLRTSMEKAIDALERNDVDAAEGYLDSARTAELRTFKTGMSYFKSTKSRILKRRNDPVIGVPTGFGIDTFMKNGGLPPKKLGVVLAPPGHGKSMTLVNFGVSAMKFGFFPVVHLTCEIDRDEVAERYDACLSEMSTGSLLDREDELYAVLRQVRERVNDDNALIIEEYNSGELSVVETEAFLKRLWGKGIKPRLLIVDYLGEMGSASGETDDEQENYFRLGGLTRGLRRACYRFDLPGWTAHQTNKHAIGKALVGLGDVADSAEIIKVADLVVTQSQTAEEKMKNLMRLTIGKSRLGPKDVEAKVYIDTSKQLMRPA